MVVYSIELAAGMMTEDAENLVQRVKEGDDAAFRQIFDLNHRLILRFLYGMVGDLDLAEELTQETFVRAYKGIGSLKNEIKLRTWLCGIAKNVAYNALRSRRRDNILEIEERSTETFQSKESSPESKLLEFELNRIIRNALLQLDQDKRTVFVLKTMQQLTYREIAEITGSSIPKLKSDLHRAKRVMRHFIRAYLETSDEL